MTRQIPKAALQICATFLLLMGAGTAHAGVAEPSDGGVVRAPGTVVEDDAASVKEFLQRVFHGKPWGMVVALIDDRGTRVFADGTMGDGTVRAVDGDTVFEIGSITKTFTTLLLQDMVQRGAMALDDPVARYLPATVHVPTYRGKEITLVHLADQSSGLPYEVSNALKVSTRDGLNPFAGYTQEQMYALVSGFELRRAPGEAFGYSNIGMGLLGDAISRKAGLDYEQLVLQRICEPLHMDSTRVALNEALNQRLATGHAATGATAPNWDIGAIVGAGGLRSTANDLAKYVAAQIAVPPGALTALMQRTHAFRHKTDPTERGNTAMPWYDQDSYSPPGLHLLGHAGATGGYTTFIGFDTEQRRGVVVLSNQSSIQSQMVGWRILQHARLSGIDPLKLQTVRRVVGTGIVLASDPAGIGVRISAIVPRSPAAAAGLAAGATVEAVDGVQTHGKTLAECITLIRGSADTNVRLAIAATEQKPATTIELHKGAFLTDE